MGWGPHTRRPRVPPGVVSGPRAVERPLPGSLTLQQRPNDYGIPMDVEVTYIQDGFLTNDVVQEMVREGWGPPKPPEPVGGRLAPHHLSPSCP